MMAIVNFFALCRKKMIKMFGRKKKNMYLCHKYGQLCPNCTYAEPIKKLYIT